MPEEEDFKLETRAGYMGEIYKYLPDEQNIKVIQRLHSAAYVKHVPPIVKMVYCVPFRYSKMQPKHKFINMVRTMNSVTH